MSMYAIQDTTLTSLGDAVRNKIISQSELPYVKETVEISSSSLDLVGVNYFPYRFNRGVKKIKIIINHPNYAEKTQTWIRYYAGYSTSQMSTEDWIELPKDTVFPYETIIEGSEITIRTLRYNSGANEDSTFTYEYIGLDENGNEFKYTPLEMVDEINGLITIPDEALNITGDCQYRFAYNGSNWLIEKYGDKITTKDISNASNMFAFSRELTSIPFEINLKDNTNIQYLFNNCGNLKYYPQVNLNLTRHISFG